MENNHTQNLENFINSIIHLSDDDINHLNSSFSLQSTSNNIYTPLLQQYISYTFPPPSTPPPPSSPPLTQPPPPSSPHSTQPPPPSSPHSTQPISSTPSSPLPSLILLSPPSSPHPPSGRSSPGPPRH